MRNREQEVRTRRGEGKYESDEQKKYQEWKVGVE
jgi:hypothetical protein